jgi:hypothetical protein
VCRVSKEFKGSKVLQVPQDLKVRKAFKAFKGKREMLG